MTSRDGEREGFDILIADKNPLILRAMKGLLSQHGGFNKIVLASDGERFLEAALRMPFQVGVIGWVMPFLNGEEVLRHLQEADSELRVLVYTGSEEPGIGARILRLGGAGLCPKSEAPENVVSTIVQIAEGKMVFPFADVAGTSQSDPLETLTARELEMLAGLSSGCTNAELAAAQFVSANTVKFHLSNIYQKLAVTSRSAAVAVYVERTARRG